MPRKANISAESYNKPFPSNLRTLMKVHHDTQETLADLLHVNRQTVSLYVNGMVSPDYEKFQMIAEHYKVSLDWLVGKTDIKTADKTLRTVCEYTGLSEESVQRLSSIKKALDEYIEFDKENVLKSKLLLMVQSNKANMLSLLDALIQSKDLETMAKSIGRVCDIVCRNHVRYIYLVDTPEHLLSEHDRQEAQLIKTMGMSEDEYMNSDDGKEIRASLYENSEAYSEFTKSVKDDPVYFKNFQSRFKNAIHSLELKEDTKRSKEIEKDLPF